MSLLKLFGVVGISLILAACGEPTLDFTSPETLEASNAEVMASLEGEDRQRYEKAADKLMRHLERNIENYKGKSMDIIRLELGDTMTGKTGHEIIEMADAIPVPVLDTTTDETAKASAQEVLANLDKAQQKTYQKALAKISKHIRKSGKPFKEREKEIREMLDGKSAEDIIAFAEGL